MEDNRNCAFQYAKTRGTLISIEIVCDKSRLTLEEAKELWNEYFPDAARWIKEGNTADMVIWINMVDPYSYNETLQYISSDAESDGTSIWVTRKLLFEKYKVEEQAE